MVTFPLDIPFGNGYISIHFLFDLLAYTVFFQFYLYLRRTQGDFLPFRTRMLLFTGGAGGALIGSRLLAALESPSLFLDPPSLLYYVIGQTVVGGLIGGIVGVEFTKVLLGEKRSTGDLLVFPLITSIALGRIGCLLTGVSDHTVGLPSSLPWAFDQGDGLPRHPTSLYEIIFLSLLGFLLYRLSIRYTFPRGALFKLFAVSYFGFRFFSEFIKPGESLFLSLTAIQLVCIGAVGYYGVYLYTLTQKTT
jgi:prolipoprotein diacylglyceryltransferase